MTTEETAALRARMAREDAALAARLERVGAVLEARVDAALALSPAPYPNAFDVLGDARVSLAAGRRSDAGSLHFAALAFCPNDLSLSGLIGDFAVTVAAHLTGRAVDAVVALAVLERRLGLT